MDDATTSPVPDSIDVCFIPFEPDGYLRQLGIAGVNITTINTRFHLGDVCDTVVTRREYEVVLAKNATHTSPSAVPATH